MKTLITILLALSCPMLTFASEECSTVKQEQTIEGKLEIKTDVPAFLKGATIIVRTADGRESSVSAEKFKVVPRLQQFITTKTKEENTISCKNVKEKNRISLLAGQGPTGKLDVSKTSNQATIEAQVGNLGGAQYQRMFTEKASIGIQGQSNGAVLINLGYDY